MKISIEEIDSGEEEILIRCHEISADILNIVKVIKSSGNMVIGKDGEELHKIDLHDVYYFETVDNKSFIYCSKNVYESKLKLYEFQDLCSGKHFFRASKSVILNSDKIDYVKPVFSGRFEANLENGEKVIVSRQYVSDLKRILGL